jgi:hypothetical protein
MQPLRFTCKLRMAGVSCLAAVLFAVTAVATARAEWAIDAYLGPTFPTDEDTGGGQDADFDGNIAGGARVGYFVPLVKHFDVGAAVDVSGVFQDIDGIKAVGTDLNGTPITVDFGDIDFNLVPITALVFFRVPFDYSALFPNGRYQLYLAGGPSLVWSELNGNGFDDQSLDIGADARAGFNFLIFKSWGVFAEYRFTYTEPDFNDHSVSTASGQFDFKIDVDSRSHYVLFGTGLRF